MRITSGQCKGRLLQSPPGLTTRPTSDRARQAVFNILAHAPWCGPAYLDGAAVLDLFAGTGALGLEALSRGAESCVFVEQDRAALTTLAANIAACKMQPHAHVLAQSATSLTARPGSVSPRTLVFCDPPYNSAAAPHQDLGCQAITRARVGQWLSPHAIIVMEMAKAYPEKIPDGLEEIDTRTYGVAQVRFLRVIHDKE